MMTGFTLWGLHFSARRIVMGSTIISSFALLLLVLFAFREIAVDEDGNVAPFKPIGSKTFASVGLTLRDIEFWRLVVFTLLLTVVKMNFRHLDALFPKFIERLFDTSSWGFMYSINPFMVIFLVPLVTRYTKQFDSFKMIIYGSLVVGFSPFFLVYPTILTAISFVVR